MSIRQRGALKDSYPSDPLCSRIDTALCVVGGNPAEREHRNFTRDTTSLSESSQTGARSLPSHRSNLSEYWAEEDQVRTPLAGNLDLTQCVTGDANDRGADFPKHSPNLSSGKLLRSGWQMDAVSPGRHRDVRPAVYQNTQKWAATIARLPPCGDDPPSEADEFVSFEILLPQLEKIDAIRGKLAGLLL